MSRLIFSNIILLVVCLLSVMELGSAFPDCTQTVYEYGCRGYGMKRSGNDAVLKHQNQELNQLTDKRLETNSYSGGSIAPLKRSFLKESPSQKGLDNLRMLLEQQKRILQLNEMLSSRILQQRDYSEEDRK